MNKQANKKWILPIGFTYALAVVISTNAGGLPEINIHGKTGYTANLGDVETMSRYAIDLLSNEELLAQFKQGAYEQALNFDIHNIVPIYEKLYSRFCRMDCEDLVTVNENSSDVN